ncbi:hypothetical protein L6452_04704 [Arctium lappa]|uniref:Uncharacterized protein n=1 Tax=Arctium lappa TaxID=4217 RepID=A0ACB9EEA0_ARCLA|nr:hypothetical protein L6452_04704 [Arctium lappa]
MSFLFNKLTLSSLCIFLRVSVYSNPVIPIRLFSTTEYLHGEVAVTVAIIRVVTFRKLHENGYNYALRKSKSFSASFHPQIGKETKS